MKKMSYFLSLAALVLVACNVEEPGLRVDQSEPAAVSPPKNKYRISYNEAVKNLYAFMDAVGGEQTRSLSSKLITSSFSLTNNKMCDATRSFGPNEDFLADTSLYIVNFGEDEGFAVLSADVRLDDIIAIAEFGHINPDDFDDAYGSEDDDESLYYDEEDDDYYIFDSDADVKLIAGLIKNYAIRTLGLNNTGEDDDDDGNGDDNEGGNDDDDDFPPPPDNDLDCKGDNIIDSTYTEPAPGSGNIGGSGPSTRSELVWLTVNKTGPFLTTTWHQGSPFNDKYPICAKTGNPYAAGCAFVAMAQIMAYLEYPGRITIGHFFPNDWVLFKELVPHNPMANTLIAEFFRNELDHVKHQGYDDGSVGVTATKIKNRFAEHGYKNTRLHKSSKYKAKTVNEMLNKGCPVYVGMSASKKKGHAWVVDGAVNQEKWTITIKTHGSFSDTTLVKKFGARRLIHCNWGWGGICNGYFLEGVFDPEEDGIEYDSDNNETGLNHKYSKKFKSITFDKPKKSNYL